MLSLSKEKKKPLYVQLYHQLQQEIMEGILAEGTILQGSRQLAKTLQVSRNTVDNAYSMLAAEGYILAKRGIGYQVAKLPRLSLGRQRTAAVRPAGCYLDSQRKAGASLEEIAYDLTNSSHTSDLFPKHLWRKYTLRALDRLDKESSLSIYLHPQGELFLRQYLRVYLERIRGVRCSEEQIIITSGLQQSLDFVCKLPGRQKQRILMEEPGYNKAAAVFQNNGLLLEGVAVDKDGLQTAKLPVGKDIGAVYCTPSHQFPTGGVLPISRRYELLAWAKQQEAFVLADDYDSELQYYAKPIPSI